MVTWLTTQVIKGRRTDLKNKKQKTKTWELYKKNISETAFSKPTRVLYFPKTKAKLQNPGNQKLEAYYNLLSFDILA